MKSMEIERINDDIASSLGQVQNEIKTFQANKDKKAVISFEGNPMYVEETLNMYYETLLWLENAAMDLHYQT